MSTPDTTDTIGNFEAVWDVWVKRTLLGSLLVVLLTIVIMFGSDNVFGRGPNKIPPEDIIELYVAIVGRPCSGKTTLFRMFTGLGFVSFYVSTEDRELGHKDCLCKRTNKDGTVELFKVRITFVSLAGQENGKTKAGRRADLRNVDGIIYMVDLTDPEMSPDVAEAAEAAKMTNKATKITTKEPSRRAGVVARDNIATDVTRYLEYCLGENRLRRLSKTTTMVRTEPHPFVIVLSNKADLHPSADSKGRISSETITNNLFRFARLKFKWINKQRCGSFVASLDRGEIHDENHVWGLFKTQTNLVRRNDVCNTLAAWIINKYLLTRPGEEVAIVG